MNMSHGRTRGNAVIKHVSDFLDVSIKFKQQCKLLDFTCGIFDKHVVGIQGFFENLFMELIRYNGYLKITLVSLVVGNCIVGIPICVKYRRFTIWVHRKRNRTMHWNRNTIAVGSIFIDGKLGIIYIADIKLHFVL